MADDRFKQWARTLEAEGRVPTIEEELAVRLREGHDLGVVCEEILKRKIKDKTITNEELFEFSLLSEGYKNYLESKGDVFHEGMRERMGEWFVFRKFYEKLMEGENVEITQRHRKAPLYYLRTTFEGRTDYLVYNAPKKRLRFGDADFFYYIASKFPQLEVVEIGQAFRNLTRDVMLGFYAGE